MSSLVWVELKAEAPDHNLRELRQSSEGALICAVVKSNAYGHGVAEIVSLLPSADWFAVNSLEEGIDLRRLGVEKPILLLGHVPLTKLVEAVRYRLRLTLYNRESLKTLAKLNMAAEEAFPVHLKLETGTGRQGLLPEDLDNFLEDFSAVPGLMLEGVLTHFANIEDTLNHDYAQDQLGRFRRGVDRIFALGFEPPLIHAACTAAAILFPETYFDMLRVGIGLYGLWPSRETYLSALMGQRPVPKLEPVLSWKTRIVQIKTLPEGHYVGYGCTYKTTRSTKVAVLPVGYADGYDRSLGNNAYVLVRGKRAPVIGRVCMNLCMIDVSDIPQVALEDEVFLLGRDGAEEISAETLAGWAGTINYEIVTRISPLLERRVRGN